MSRNATQQRWFGLALLLVSFALSFGANGAAADLRYPLAIFVLVLSFVCLGSALCLLSRRLGARFGRMVLALMEVFLA